MSAWAIAAGVVGVLVACDVAVLAGMATPGSMVPGAQAADWVPASVNGWIEAMVPGEGGGGGPRLAEEGGGETARSAGGWKGATAGHLRRAGVAESVGGRVHLSFCTS